MPSKCQSLYIVLGSVLFLAGAGPAGAQNAQSVSAHGVAVEVKDLRKETNGSWTFELKTTNMGPEERKLYGRITLLQQSPSAQPDPPPDTVGECIVTIAVAAGETKKSLALCRGSYHTMFRFEFTAIYGPGGRALALDRGGNAPSIPGRKEDPKEERSATSDGTPIVRSGLTIHVKELRTKIGRAWRFELQIKNAAAEKRRFEAYLTLYRPSTSATSGPPPEQIARCWVGWTANPGVTQNVGTSCTGGTYTSWRLKIARVFDEKGKVLAPQEK